VHADGRGWVCLERRLARGHVHAQLREQSYSCDP
jgi:hypothetical protein